MEDHEQRVQRLGRRIAEASAPPRFRPRSLDMVGDYEILTPEGSIGFGWETQDLSPPGACGDASDADAERGKLLVEHAAGRFV